MRDKLLKNPLHKNNSSFNNSLNQKIELVRRQTKLMASEEFNYDYNGNLLAIYRQTNLKTEKTKILKTMYKINTKETI